jgi:hypothetical protein
MEYPVTDTKNPGKAKKVRTELNRNNPSYSKVNNKPSIDKIINEDDGNFLNYLLCLGLANDPNMLVLSSRNHYYYDFEELTGVRTLINQKKLNQIKQLNDFLNTLCNVLSPTTNFIGCFSDIKAQKGNGLISRLYRKFINFLDSRIDIDIDKKDISILLESHGFKVKNMTEINGLTYFLTQN